MKILVTGAAGFIGYHVSKALLMQNFSVFGLDNLNDYYEVQLKKDRLAQLETFKQFHFVFQNLQDQAKIKQLFAEEKFTHVIHLAAQAGVRYSLENPFVYVESNIAGTLSILEACRHHPVQHLLYASSSSVYGLNAKVPYSVDDPVNHPVSLYAATKRSTELLAHSYAHLYTIPTTGLRFFTVYGPWGRPDMAPMKFAKAIYHKQPIDVYNFGEMYRDFTYIDDVVEGVIKLLDLPAEPDPHWDALKPSPSTSSAPYRLYNLGNHSPVSLLNFIETLEQAIGIPAEKNFLPMQPGDVRQTFADIEISTDRFGFTPKTQLPEGIREFINWYKSYYKISGVHAEVNSAYHDGGLQGGES